MSVTSGLALEVDATISTLTGVKYQISDPVDVEEGAMLNAFLVLCELWATKAKRMDQDIRRAKVQEYQTALTRALEADNRRIEHAVIGGGNGYLPKYAEQALPDAS